MMRRRNPLPALLCALLACLLLTGSAACTAGAAQDTAVGCETGFDSCGNQAAPCLSDESGAVLQSCMSPGLEASLSAAIFDEVNAARASAGLAPLTEQPALAETAGIRAREAAVCWSHTRPDGSPWYTAGTGAGAAYGENLAKGFAYPSARQHAAAVVAAWLASPSHADNILSPDFHWAYVSACRNATGTIYEAAEFAY